MRNEYLGEHPPRQRPPDQLLVAWAPSTSQAKQDGLVVLAHNSGPGLVLWIDTVSPNMGQWWEEGVPLPTRTMRKGLWIWEGAVEGRVNERTGKHLPALWTGDWRPAQLVDLVALGFLPQVRPGEMLNGFARLVHGDWSRQDAAVTEGT
jgi:hypothetical protein